MSLLAATLIASSAFAIDNIKASGDAKLYYSTSDDADNSLFNKNGAAGQAAASLSISADLTEGISAGSKITALSTLGLEGQLVNNVWEAPSGLTDSFIVNELWLAGTIGKTTGKIGRMPLDTPLVFTETWSITENTFEAAVLINQDIPDTTLVGAYVGGSNAQAFGGSGAGIGGVISTSANGSTFSQFYKGAYAAGAVNNSWAPLTAQAWYYGATSTVNAYWLQADLALDFGLLLGAEFTGLDIKEGALADATATPPFAGLNDSSNTAWAVMAGYEMKDSFKISVAYSQTGEDKDNSVGAGMNLAGSGQSKLYTSAWWNSQIVATVDTSAINFTATTPEELTYVGLGLYVTQVTVGENGTGADKNADLLEVTLEASKSFGPLDTSLVYILTDQEGVNLSTAGDATTGQSFNTVQAYLTYNF